MPRVTTKKNGNGHSETLSPEILARIDERLSRIQDRQDAEAVRMDALAASYAKLAEAVNKHGWEKVGQIAVEILGFIGVIWTILSRR